MTDVSVFSPDDIVSFVPMESVSEKTGDIQLRETVFSAVSTGYTRFSENDLLWAKITPCMQNGKTAIARGLKNGIGFGSTEFHVLRPLNDRVSVDYLWALLSLDSFLISAQGAFTGSAGQQRVTQEFLQNLPIPLPPLETQRVLVSELEAARQSRRDKLAQADALLSSLDGWLLDQLGLQPPREEKRACFAVRLGDVRSRFDADFHSPRFQALRTSIENSGFDVVSVKEVAVYVRSGFASGRDDQADDAESGVPHIRPMNITPQGEFSLANAKFVPRAAVSAADWLQKGEVIFNNTNSTAWVGKTGVFAGETECACSNHMTRIQFNEKVLPDFVAPLFNALRSTGLFGLMSTNFNNQAGINSTTLEMFRFPLPQLPIQQAIAGEVRSRREQARRLRDEAQADWSAAKAHFEAQLLGKTNNRVLDSV